MSTVKGSAKRISTGHRSALTRPIASAPASAPVTSETSTVGDTQPSASSATAVTIHTARVRATARRPWKRRTAQPAGACRTR